MEEWKQGAERTSKEGKTDFLEEEEGQEVEKGGIKMPIH